MASDDATKEANTEARCAISATVTDQDNDLVGGRIELSDQVKTLTLPIDSNSLRGSTIGVTLVTNRVPAGTYPGTFAVVDAAGHRSNEISFSVTVTGEGLQEGMRGGVMQRLLPAR